MFEHSDRALTIRAGCSHTAVYRKRAEQGEQYEHTRCQRREHASRQKCDAWLVSERGKVIDPSQAHDLPPRVLVMFVFPRVRSFGAFVTVLQEPALQARIYFVLWIRKLIHAWGKTRRSSTNNKILPDK